MDALHAEPLTALLWYRAHAHDDTRTNEREAYAMTCHSHSEQVLPRYSKRFFFFCVWPTLANFFMWVRLAWQMCAQSTRRTLESLFFSFLTYIAILANLPQWVCLAWRTCTSARSFLGAFNCGNYTQTICSTALLLKYRTWTLPVLVSVVKVLRRRKLLFRAPPQLCDSLPSNFY